MTSSSIATVPHYLALFGRVESRYPKATLGAERWFIIVLSVFTSAGKPGLAADLYLHLTSLPQYSTSTARKDLIKRLREVLVKLTSVIGVARPLEAIISMDKVTLPDDRDTSFSREHWKNDSTHHVRGMDWLRKLYSENLDPIYDMFESHKDFGWITSEITYGLYLSDHTILDDVETELVVISAMVCLDLPRMTGWHLRAMRRIEISSEDCESVQCCIETILQELNVKVGPLPRVKDIEHEVRPIKKEKDT